MTKSKYLSGYCFIPSMQSILKTSDKGIFLKRLEVKSLPVYSPAANLFFRHFATRYFPGVSNPSIFVSVPLVAVIGSNKFSGRRAGLEPANTLHGPLSILHPPTYKNPAPTKEEDPLIKRTLI